VSRDELVQLDGEWWSSWRRWPHESVSPELLLAAADWCSDVLLCECSREGFKAKPEAERRGMVSVFIGWLADGFGRSVVGPDGRRFFPLVRRCLGRRCGRFDLVRVELVWPV